MVLLHSYCLLPAVHAAVAENALNQTPRFGRDRCAPRGALVRLVGLLVRPHLLPIRCIPLADILSTPGTILSRPPRCMCELFLARGSIVRLILRMTTCNNLWPFQVLTSSRGDLFSIAIVLFLCLLRLAATAVVIETVWTAPFLSKLTV